MPVDLSLYLVTDSTPAILKGRDLCTVVEEACKGGMTGELKLTTRELLDHANSRD
jgi:thiamine monophosphate synthase